eukprot:7368060-Pyramimonas_sp.AAC.1
MEEGAALPGQGMQNLRALTRGDLHFAIARWALRQLDYATSERLLPGRSSHVVFPAEGPTEAEGAAADTSHSFPRSFGPP